MLQTSMTSSTCCNECRMDFCMIRTTAGIFHPVSQSLFKCTTSCFRAQGRHLEDFLQSSRGCNSKPTFQTACVLTIFCVFWCGLNSVGLAVQVCSLCAITVIYSVIKLARLKIPGQNALKSNSKTCLSLRKKKECPTKF